MALVEALQPVVPSFNRVRRSRNTVHTCHILIPCLNCKQGRTVSPATPLSTTSKVGMFKKGCHFIQVIDLGHGLSYKFKRLNNIGRWDESQGRQTSYVSSDFVVTLVLRLQPDFVHFPNHALVEMKIATGDSCGRECLMKGIH